MAMRNLDDFRTWRFGDITIGREGPKLGESGPTDPE
jgi:hypothetical protein